MINAGSIGRPYEHEPGAYWLRLGPDVRLMRTAYDTATADAAFRALGYPAAHLDVRAGRRGRGGRALRALERGAARGRSLIDPAENPLARR